MPSSAISKAFDMLENFQEFPKILDENHNFI